MKAATRRRQRRDGDRSGTFAAEERLAVNKKDRNVGGGTVAAEERLADKNDDVVTIDLCLFKFEIRKKTKKKNLIYRSFL
ncbi:hypothetical protein Bca4012_091550 [Brassica carinata]